MRLTIRPIGFALGLLLAITFVLDVIGGLLFPTFWTMYKAWGLLLPGFTWLTWGSFLYGLIVSFLSGWYIAIVFVPLFNYFNRAASESPAATATKMTPMGQH